VVTLRGAFKGTALVAEAEKQLRELGAVAAAHVSFPLQVVVHDATPPGDAQKTEDMARANAALAALTAGGASTAQAATETVGARLPMTDPTDPTSRARNARLEVVFVSRSD
jgi:flagellar motor protein MotB